MRALDVVALGVVFAWFAHRRAWLRRIQAMHHKLRREAAHDAKRLGFD